MKNNKGITLIALVVTIVVLLILAGVSISMLTGENGTITQASNTKEKNAHATIYEGVRLKKQDHVINKSTMKDYDKSLIGYYEAEGIITKSTIIEDEYIINVQKLLGDKIYLGNGTDEKNDVYKLVKSEENEYAYILVYVKKDGSTPVEIGTINDKTSSGSGVADEGQEFEWIYRENAEGNIEITGANFKGFDFYDEERVYWQEYNIDFETLIVPSTINGKKVVKLGWEESLLQEKQGFPLADVYLKGVKKIIYANTIEEIPTEAYPKMIFSNVEEIELPDNLKTIGQGAFSNYSSLKSIVIPEGVTSIDAYAFNSCSNLASVNIPSSITYIGGHAFANCSNLTSINIPSSVTTIEENAFISCAKVKTISVAESNTVYDSRDNCNAIIETSTNKLIFGCQNTIIPSTVTCIEDFAFEGCSNLTSINIPSNVISIGYGAFSYCSSLTSVNIAEGVTSIEGRAFWGCSNLTSINIPEGVTNIGEEAFCYCSNLTNINIPSSVINIGYSAFDDGEDRLTSVNFPNGKNNALEIDEDKWGANKIIISGVEYNP